MSSLFQSYEEDYLETLKSLRQCMDTVKESLVNQKAHAADATKGYHPPSSTGPMSRLGQIQAAYDYLAHIQQLVNSMSYECNDLDELQRQAASTRASTYKKDTSAIATELSQLRQESTAADRADLVVFSASADRKDGYFTAADDATQSQRLMALQTSDKLQSGTNTLMRAEAYLAQSNEMGYSSLSVLRTQTEQIQHIHDTTYDVDEEISRSQRVIQQMQRMATQHRLYLVGIIVLLILFISFLIYAGV